jgi:antitoxin (DNA-binding transcriptional repressor) of toxin-antitoxin stability system
VDFTQFRRSLLSWYVLEMKPANARRSACHVRATIKYRRMTRSERKPELAAHPSPLAPLSEAQATRLATLERVRKTGPPLLITRFGKPIAKIVPPTPSAIAKNWLGDMRGTARIVGNITGPSGELVELKATK